MFEDSDTTLDLCIFDLGEGISTSDTFFEIAEAEEEEECFIGELGLCNEDQDDKKIDMSSIKIILKIMLCNFLVNKGKARLREDP